MSGLREIKMGKTETLRERGGEIKEEQQSQCVVSHSHLLVSHPWWEYVPHTEKQRQTLTLNSTSSDSFTKKNSIYTENSI